MNEKGIPQRNNLLEDGGIRADGVFENGEINNIYVSSYEYWHDQLTKIGEYYLYDASFVKLREVRLAYLFPSKLSGPFTRIELSLVGKNLAILHKNVPNVDPESAYGSGNIQGFESGQHPSTRSLGFNLKLSL